MQNRRTRRVIAATAAVAAVATLALAAVALATPSTGTITPVVIGAGTMAKEIDFTARPGTNTVVAQYTFGPNSSTGWHSHPGRTLVTVQSGTFTVYHDEDCHPHVYEAGDAFIEKRTSIHVGRNETDGTVQLGVVFFRVPIGGSPRIDQPQPTTCDVT